MPQEKQKKQYSDMTRQELENIAKEKGLPATSAKSKDDLVHELETWQGRPQDEHSQLHRKNMEELIEMAKEKNISGKYDMNKEELVIAIQKAGSSSGKEEQQERQSKKEESSNRPAAKREEEKGEKSKQKESKRKD